MKIMKRRRLLGLFLLLFVTAFFSIACEPGGEPIIENQRDQEVRIYVTIVRADGTLDEPIDYGVVPAQTTEKLASITFLRKMVVRIEAKDPSGGVVFSHDYNMYDLEKIDWKITILP